MTKTYPPTCNAHRPFAFRPRRVYATRPSLFLLRPLRFLSSTTGAETGAGGSLAGPGLPLAACSLFLLFFSFLPFLSASSAAAAAALDGLEVGGGGLIAAAAPAGLGALSILRRFELLGGGGVGSLGGGGWVL